MREQFDKTIGTFSVRNFDDFHIEMCAVALRMAAELELTDPYLYTVSDDKKLSVAVLNVDDRRLAIALSHVFVAIDDALYAAIVCEAWRTEIRSDTIPHFPYGHIADLPRDQRQEVLVIYSEDRYGHSHISQFEITTDVRGQRLFGKEETNEGVVKQEIIWAPLFGLLQTIVAKGVPMTAARMFVKEYSTIALEKSMEKSST